MGEKVENEITHYWHNPHLNNLELLKADYLHHVFSRHAHEEYAIGVIERGCESFDYRHARHEAPAGSVVMVNPGEVHTGQAATSYGWSYRMFYPSVEVLQEAAAQLTGRAGLIPFFRPAVTPDLELARRLGRLHRLLEQGGSALESQSEWLLILARLIERYADQPLTSTRLGVEDQAVERVRQYLAAYYPRNITLEELSRVANLSQFHLVRVFRQQTGLPPHFYLTQLRVIRARELLRQGHSPVMVAAATGFVDQSHLNRHFKRIVGVTPGQYRFRPLERGE